MYTDVCVCACVYMCTRMYVCACDVCVCGVCDGEDSISSNPVSRKTLVLKH